MKRALIGTGLVVLIMTCSFHFSIVYLNYIRTLGIGFTPGVSMLLKPTLKQHDKDIFQVK